MFRQVLSKQDLPTDVILILEMTSNRLKSSLPSNTMSNDGTLRLKLTERYQDIFLLGTVCMRGPYCLVQRSMKYGFNDSLHRSQRIESSITNYINKVSLSVSTKTIAINCDTHSLTKLRLSHLKEPYRF